MKANGALACAQDTLAESNRQRPPPVRPRVNKKGACMGNKYKKRSRARKYTPRLQIVLDKSNYLPFFILFLTSNTSISPDCGRFLTSASFPFSRICSIAFISLSFNMIPFYHILSCFMVSHFKNSGRFPRR